MASSKTLLIIGSGPGIGRAVTTLFASKRYRNVVLVARRARQLREEQIAVERAVGSHVNVTTLAVDITQTDALLDALDEVDAAVGKPECVFFNAARVLPSPLLDHDVKEIEYDLKITISSLYAVAQRYIPHLVSLAKTDRSSKPALLVTSSMLPMEPIPELFALSLVKAAQRNLVQSLNKAYGPQGVHIGVVNVSGPVALEEKERNPTNIAAKTWEWFEQGNAFEVVI
ncbi:Short-chain alcohol dehydrogenase [Madurella fahalii]|uniref:Short-chain alcohol dehydrogenase n=1 Tax=Madurella fahalii TaxID=1157608 RepID=A0ABQ0GKM2_9PEZI